MTTERYRKVAVRIWADREFRRLSRPQPNGQSLFFYLLTGRETAIIPGVISARESGMAEELGWPLEAFREAFGEVSGEAFGKGLRGAEKAMAKADWEAGLVFVPNAIKHNAPQSPNVITSWKNAWDELPECDLKAEIYQSLRAFMKGKNKAFLEAFDAAIPKPSWKPSDKALANQEQEQEQEQERERGAARPLSPEVSSQPEPETETPLNGDRFRLRKHIESRFTALAVSATGFPPGKGDRFPQQLTKLTAWVWEAATTRNIEEIPLADKLLAAFFANDEARAKGYPFAFLAQSPPQYLAAPQAAKAAEPVPMCRRPL